MLLNVFDQNTLNSLDTINIRSLKREDFRWLTRLTASKSYLCVIILEILAASLVRIGVEHNAQLFTNRLFSESVCSL